MSCKGSYKYYSQQDSFDTDKILCCMIDSDLLIAYGAAYKNVVANETIFEEGAECHFYYQLEGGSIKWVNIDDTGTEFIHIMVVPGECVGEMSLFDKQPYAASAIAETKSIILRLHAPSFQKLISENPEILLLFTKLMAQRLRYKFLMSKEIAFHKPEQTISSLLNHFKKSNLHFCNDCSRLNLTRQQIADMTGMRVETVIRTIRSMHIRGKLKIEKGRVYC